jgi:hypothetical protein
MPVFVDSDADNSDIAVSYIADPNAAMRDIAVTNAVIPDIAA